MTQPYATGALPSPPEVLAQGWDIRLALAPAPVAAPAKFHHPGCGPTLDQNPWGACTGFGTTSAHAAQELADEGRMLIPNVLDALRLYANAKGLPWPPGEGWDPSPGAWPEQILRYGKASGIPTKDGSPPRKIGPYFLIGTPTGSAAFLELYQQTLIQLGPAVFSTLWTHNWFSVDAAGFLAAPSFSFTPSGHLWEACGYEVGCKTGFPGCTWDTIGHQSWGRWGRDPEFLDHFRIHSPHLSQVGVESWKWTDPKGDWPMPLTLTDKISRLLDTRLGAPIINTDDGLPLVVGGVALTIKSGPLDIASPGAASGGHYAVVISTGGKLRLAALRAADCTNIRPQGTTDPAAIKGAFNEGVTAAGAAALTAKKP